MTGAASDADGGAADRLYDVLGAIRDYEAPTLAVLREKLDLLATRFDFDDDRGPYEAAIFADLRRLAS